MELRHLKGFLAVAQEQSFTRAAEKLHMAQPPLSQRIRELEEELGVKLFERCTRSVHLTQAGASFLEGVQSIFLQLEQAVEACRQVDRGQTGLLRVGYTGRASHQLLPRLVLHFRQHFLGREDGHLAMHARRLALPPDVDLRVDDLHAEV